MIPTAPATQIAHPWRSTARTVLQAAVALAVLAPTIWTAATQDDPATATGLAAGVLAVAGGFARVMALPGVENFLQSYLPFLAAGPDVGTAGASPAAGGEE